MAMLSDPEIVQRYEAGESQNAIAKIDGRKHPSIGWVLKRSGIPLRSRIEEQRKAGRIRGPIAVKSGQLAGIVAKGGRVAGRIQGPKNVKSGHLARIVELPQTKEAHRIQGREAVESGRIWDVQAKSKTTTKNTKPEIRVFRFLDALGLPYRKHVIIRGFQSDVVIEHNGRKISINVDGSCWWHPASCDKEVCELREQRLATHDGQSGVRHDRNRDRAISDAGYEVVIIPPHHPSVELKRVIDELV